MASPQEILRDAIEKEVYVKRGQEGIIPETSKWLMDFRRVCLDPTFLDAYTEEFYERFKNELPFQVGGMEVAAIPLVAAIVMKMREKGRPISGFFIRKSRKKAGLLKMVEGRIIDAPVILVDDLMNSGQTFERQIAVTEEAKATVKAVFVILRFRDLDYYKKFDEQGIRVESLFSLDDFKGSLEISNLNTAGEKPIPIVLEAKWRFQAKDPKLEWVRPKSGVVLDETRAYFGSDRGVIFALDKRDGSVVWESKIGLVAKGPEIFSTPVLVGDALYFAAYDGNIYCLEKNTGKRKWVSFEADWVEGELLALPPCNMLLVPSLFGLWNKAGGMIALDLRTGKKIWEKLLPASVTGSFVYSPNYDAIFGGSQDGTVYSLKRKDGQIRWSYKTEGAIPSGGALSPNQEVLVVNSMDGNIYAFHTRDGKLEWKFNVGLANYSSPLIWKGKVYSASLDKSLYCLNLETGKKLWSFITRSRIFASPRIYGGRLYLGSNDARLYALNPETGKQTDYFQVTERITNPLMYDEKTQLFYLITYANELYCLKRRAPQVLKS